MDVPSWKPWTPDETVSDLLVLVVAVDLGRRGDETLLDAEERSRAVRLHEQRHRWRFIAAHAALRQVLGACTARPAASLRFLVGPQGKPELVDGGPWRFNLSHSDDLALIAVTRERAIGVDVERHRPGVATGDLARRFFAPAEVADLAAVPAARREEAFFTCWSRKEAVVKALGTGMHTPLDSFAVAVDPLAPACVRHQPAAWPAWTLAHLDLGPGWSGAVAAAGGGWTVATRLLSP